MSCYHTWAAEWKEVGGRGEEYKEEEEEACKSLTLWRYQFNWLYITFGMMLYYFFGCQSYSQRKQWWGIGAKPMLVSYMTIQITIGGTSITTLKTVFTVAGSRSPHISGAYWPCLLVIWQFRWLLVGHPWPHWGYLVTDAGSRSQHSPGAHQLHSLGGRAAWGVEQV